MIDLSGYSFERLRQDGEFVLSRGRRADGPTVLLLAAASEHPAPATLHQLDHIFSLRNELDSAWAIRPIDLAERRGQGLVLDELGGDFLDGMLRQPLALKEQLSLAIGLTHSLGLLHARGLVHRDIKPAHVVVNVTSGKAWLTGFAATSRLPRQRQPLEPPEVIAGTLAYMAPEQTGRMNRSSDSRSDLYSLGVTLYEMFVGELPFTACDPMEWVHCHIARLPVAPSLRCASLPEPISAMILKLLAKAPEERYQTAAGLEADLRRCLAQMESRGRIESFSLAAEDVPRRILVPEKLYGREREVELLLAAFERVMREERAELVLVSGYSGVGKSSVVNELHKALVPPRGLFASGKFDQYKRDIPYATLAQAFQNLVRQILGKSTAEVSRWRSALVKALGANGQIIVNLIPETELIIGKQPAVAELSPQETQARFQTVFRRFLGVFARAEHPLALFLDDLQWLDAATLKLLEYLVTAPDLSHVIFIGAYRDNEVGPSHPLARTLATMRTSGARIAEIVLKPLALGDVTRLVADSLRGGGADPLAQIVFEKTEGNPFFAIQFIAELDEEGLLAFDPGAGAWKWDADRIRAKGYTDNVVDLMAGKLSRFPEPTQDALKLLACLGNGAEFETLRLIGETADVEEQLWEAVRAGLVVRAGISYRFLHDRVQEAAYALIPTEERAEMHLRIGRHLAASTPEERLVDAIFDIANQYNRGAHLISSTEERELVAELNLIAGRRAKLSTAYASALTYLHAGSALLNPERWEPGHAVMFAIECLIAECELLTAEMVSAEKRLALLARGATTRHDCAVVTRLQLTLYTTLDRSDRAIEVFLDYLRAEGTNWSQHPTRGDVMREYERIWALVGERQIEELVDLPIMTSGDVLDMLDVFTEIVHPAMFYDENLSSLVVLRMVSLSLEYGNCDAACFGYVWFGMFAGPRFDNYTDGFRFGQLGYDLVEKRGLTRYEARTYISFGTLTPWARHALKGRELVQRAFDVAYRTGDLTFSAYSWHELITNYLAVGDPLPGVQAEAEKGLAFVRKAGFGLVAENLEAQSGLIRTLRGLTSNFGRLDGPGYGEEETERRLASNPMLALAEFFYWTRKLQARFFAGDHAAAVEASLRAQVLLWPAASQVETADFRFFGALAQAAAWDLASAAERPRHFEALLGHQRQLEIWARHCPANFASRNALAGAEIARIEGRMIDAEQLYETAIRSADDNGLTHVEAVANEGAAGFYSARGLPRIAEVYWREARNCYLRWGADAKVRQLDGLHPNLGEEKATRVAGNSIEHLDLATVIKVSQAVSSEIELERLIDILMRTAIEHAGAERGLLIVPQGDGWQVDAEAAIVEGAISVRVRGLEEIAAELPESMVQYVARTRESVILDDALVENAFSQDGYLRGHRVRSVLCLPLLKQAKLIGVLYLENNLASGVFTPARVAVLKMLASAAAISLENTRLYGEQMRAEEAMRRAQMELAHVSRITTLGELTASIAHEVNQPLGSVINNANACLGFLASGVNQIEEVRDALTEIIEGAERASAVISRVRNLSKNRPFEHTVVGLDDVVAEVVALVRHEAFNREVAIETQMEEALPAIQGDRVQLQQVLLNLVVNGMDAMSAVEPAGRRIVITTRGEMRDEAAWCVLSVRDAGLGIKPDDRERLFEAFYTTKAEGMGMGLAISRSIIEAHGGRLWAEGNPEAGATFSFRLPVARAPSS